MSRVDVKEAVKRAKATLVELFVDDPPKGLALEEIELLSENGRELWAVTFGFERRKSVSAVQPTGLAGLFNPTSPAQVEHRVYKTILLDASSGDFVRMDMRLAQ